MEHTCACIHSGGWRHAHCGSGEEGRQAELHLHGLHTYMDPQLRMPCSACMRRIGLQCLLFVSGCLRRRRRLYLPRYTTGEVLALMSWPRLGKTSFSEPPSHLVISAETRSLQQPVTAPAGILACPPGFFGWFTVPLW